MQDIKNCGSQSGGGEIDFVTHCPRSRGPSIIDFVRLSQYRAAEKLIYLNPHLRGRGYKCGVCACWEGSADHG
jgi:hypothetical protein